MSERARRLNNPHLFIALIQASYLLNMKRSQRENSSRRCCVADSDTCDAASWATTPLMRRVAQRPHVRIRLEEKVNMVVDFRRLLLGDNCGTRQGAQEQMRCEREQHRTLQVSSLQGVVSRRFLAIIVVSITSAMSIAVRVKHITKNLRPTRLPVFLSSGTPNF